MNDLFARVGVALQHLLEGSTLNGDVKADGLRLAKELQSAEVDINALVSERVRAEVEAITGRVAAVEGESRRTKDVLFSTETVAALDAALEHRPETREALAAIFEERTLSVQEPASEPQPDPEIIVTNGAEPNIFDHDGDGSPGGSEPRPPTDNLVEMTVAQLKEALDDLEVGYAASAKKAELQELLENATAPAEPASSGVAETSA